VEDLLVQGQPPSPEAAQYGVQPGGGAKLGAALGEAQQPGALAKASMTNAT